jgi:hypothetical protein
MTFDPSKVAKTYSTLPEGEYNLVIEKSEGKVSKAGNKMFSLKFRVEDGEYSGRFLFENILTEHDKLGVVEMNVAKMHGLMAMTGVLKPREPEDFTGRTLRAMVKVVKDKGTGEMKNEVSFRVNVSKVAEVQSSKNDEKKPERKGSAGGDW